MEQLLEYVERGEWSQAQQLAQELDIGPDYVAKRQFLQSANLTPALLSSLLTTITDSLFVAQAAAQVLRSTNQLQLAKLALRFGFAALDRLVSPPLLDLIQQRESPHVSERLQELMVEDEGVRTVCVIRRAMLEYQDKLSTWESIWGHTEIVPTPEEDAKEETDDETGWDELDLPSPAAPESTDPSHPTLRHFLDRDILPTALSLAASAQLSSLTTLCSRHSTLLWPHRFRIIDVIPEWTDPTEYVSLLSIADSAGREQRWTSHPWRATADWIEVLWPTTLPDFPQLTAEALTTYYSERIAKIANLGLVAESLSLVQHCASRGVTGLDSIGEELSLLSKLAHDRPGSFETEEEFTLARWRSMSNQEVVHAYLAYSTPSTISRDIRRLVMPFLHLLESRLEKSSTPDPSLATRELYSYILHLASTPHRPPGKNTAIGLLVAIFEGSKPTLAKSSRIIRSDEDLARLALASLYGCKDITPKAFVAMGAIFECLPAFEGANSDDLPQSTLFDLFSSTASPTAPSLFAALQSFTAASLSASLDALDFHLATAETFSRYSVPVPLLWFITSHSDSKAQRAWATRMARTASSGGGGARGNEGEFESEDEWVGLMEDMVGLTEEEGGRDEEMMKKAFWLLDREEVLRIFFAGLLASGKFGLAKSLFRHTTGKSPLSTEIEEELVLAASREFYDNAESGNLHQGEMKLAYDCLSAAPQTPTILHEKEFIEATSRLYTFKISTPSSPLAPISIRLSSNRLTFISRLLASNEDSYRHPDVILDLVNKLGYRGDKLAEIRALCMMADSGLQAGDYTKSAEICESLFGEVEALRRKAGVVGGGAGSGIMEKQLEEAKEVAWRSCFQLGKHEDFVDLGLRMKLLGQAMILCPSNKISSILTLWTTLESRLDSAPIPNPSSHLQNPLLFLGDPTITLSPALAAEAAARTFSRAAAYFPTAFRTTSPNLPSPSSPSLSLGQSSSLFNDVGGSAIRSMSPGGMRSGLGVRDGAAVLGAGISSRLTKGVGWLIGADADQQQRGAR